MYANGVAGLIIRLIKSVKYKSKLLKVLRTIRSPGMLQTDMSISTKLAKLEYKLTKPRLQVINSLEKEKKLISARNLHEKIKTIDRASVYRTLNLLEELHLVNVEIIEKEKLYCLANHPHHHIICRKCGYAEEFDCDNSEFKKFKNFSKIHHQLTLTGVCNNCNS